MKYLIILTALFMMGSGDYASAQTDDEPKYSMKTYFFVFLKTGTNTTADTADVSKAFSGHMENIKAMNKAGKLKLAGPFKDKGELRGIFIIDAETEEEVNGLLSHDPAIESGLLSAEIKKWYGPKGLTVMPDK
jgi:uncharacterized protein YciI